ncbi:nicotinate-nicotinamide nucleotide adenylyltransferase [Paracoccaceae bacterium]|nr:nicotinate-nicotinamide nucleotide adenylyltransferase [Paracoccaceae bacterium]
MQLEPETTLGRIGYRRPIGLLGGSFNPPHLGHVHISKVSMRMFDLGQIYWVYTKKNPLKKVGPSSFDDRVKKTKKLVKSPNIKLSAIEIRQNFHCSFQLLNFVQKRHRNIKFIWVMGEDNIIQFHLWKNWQWIANNVRIAVVARGRNRSLVNSSTFAFKYRRFRLMSGQSAQLQHYKPPIWCMVDSKRLNLSSSDLRSNA